MSATELLMSAAILLGLAILRFGVPFSITWLVGKLLRSSSPSSS